MSRSPCFCQATVGGLLEGNGRKGVSKPSFEGPLSRALFFRGLGSSCSSHTLPPLLLLAQQVGGSAPSNSGLFLGVDYPEPSAALEEFSALQDPCCSRYPEQGRNGSSVSGASQARLSDMLDPPGRKKGLSTPLPQRILLRLFSLLACSSPAFSSSFSLIYFSLSANTHACFVNSHHFRQKEKKASSAFQKKPQKLSNDNVLTNTFLGITGDWGCRDV